MVALPASARQRGFCRSTPPRNPHGHHQRGHNTAAQAVVARSRAHRVSAGRSDTCDCCDRAMCPIYGAHQFDPRQVLRPTRPLRQMRMHRNISEACPGIWPRHAGGVRKRTHPRHQIDTWGLARSDCAATQACSVCDPRARPQGGDRKRRGWPSRSCAVSSIPLAANRYRVWLMPARPVVRLPRPMWQ